MAKQVDLNEWVADVIATEGDKRYVKKESGKGLSTNDYTTAEKNKLSGIEAQANKTNVDSSLSTNSENPVQNKVINAALITKVDKEVGKGLFSGSYNDLTNKPNIPNNTNQLTNGAGFLTRADIENLGGNVTVEQQASPDSGYTATYVIKQDGTQVGTKINIPKDFLVRRATVETSIANNSPQTGFVKGDKYLDFVVNTKDNSGVDEHLYINVNDLFNEYEADEVTLTLSADNVFSIKNGVIPQANTTASNIKMNGAQSAGTANTWAKSDHVHPVDTSRAASSHTHTKTEITDFPTSMTPTSHAHGSITNNGTLNTDTNNVNKVVVTDSNQNIRTISKIPYAKIDNTPTIPSKLSELTNDKGYVTSNEVAGNIDLTDYVKTNDLATVATSGSYNDLSNKPTIPTKITDLTNDSNFLTSHSPIDSSLSSTSTNAVQNKVINTALAGKAASNHNHDGTYLKTHQDISGKEDKSNKVTSWSTTTTDDHYPSEKLVKTGLDGKASSTHNHDGVYQPVGNYLTSHQSLDSKTVTLTKLTGNNITSGYLSTYEIKQGTTSLGKIDIPKDYLVKSGSVKTVTTANSPVNGYAVGDKYIDFVINTKDSSGTDEHIYIKAKDIMPTKTSELTNDSGFITSSNISGKIDTAGTGLSKSGTTLNHSNSVTAQTTAVFKKIKYDAQGHITGITDVEKADITGLGIPGSDTTYSADNTTLQKDNNNVFSIKNLPSHNHDDRYYTETEIQNNYVAKEDLEDMVGLSYDDSTGILTITFDTN